MYQRVSRWVGAAAFLAVVGLVAFFVAGRFASGGAEGQPAVRGDEWFRDLAATVEPISQADQAKPRFRGRLGDFTVVGQGETDPSIDRLCSAQVAQSIDDVTQIQSSELYVPSFGDVDLATMCPDGTINLLQGHRQGTAAGDSTFIRSYFVGNAIVRREAPRDRLELITINGHPALLERPLAVSPFPSMTSLHVIERMAQEGQPGLIVGIDTYAGVDAALQLAKEITR